MAAFGKLTVDEGYFLDATRILAELDGGEQSFDIWAAMNAYHDSPYVSQRLQADGFELGGNRPIARGLVAAAFIPEDHHDHLAEYRGDLETLSDSEADAVRAAMWSFLSAWTTRYGGVMGKLVKSYTLVDPRLRDAPRDR
jgi:hypothetical protein